MKKIAIIRKGDFSIQVYNLASELARHDIAITAIISMNEGEANISTELLDKISGQIGIFRLKDVSRGYYKWGKILLNKLNRASNHFIVSPWLIYKTRRRFRNDHFDYIIAIGPESLYWAFNSFPDKRGKIIYYNLEVIYSGHPFTKTDRLWQRIVAFEQDVFNSIGGIMIQDRFRADVLINGLPDFQQHKLIFHPVCIAEDKVMRKNSYLRDKFSLPATQVIVLYFGGIWEGRFLKDIIKAAEKISENTKIVIHGGKGAFSLQADKSNVIVSNERLPYSQITKLISSADIGLALYSAENYNDAYTAYSSEKISRYCQCGVPFIAFENKNYLFFKKDYDCCVLIKDISQLNDAIQTIIDNYHYYSQNAYRAFDDLFDNKKQIVPVVDFLNR